MPETHTDFLDPAYLSSIDNIKLMSKLAVEGYLSGLHRSVFHGFGMEFMQYRNYTPGEDLKYLDWKVLAKSNKLYTKVFEEETNMDCRVILDVSASLDYQGKRASCSKFKYACMLAACIVYLATKQGDNVGLYTYSDGLKEVVEPGHRVGQLNRCLQAITRLEPSGVADHEQCLSSLTYHFQRKGTVVYISDMLEAENVLPALLKRFRIRRSNVLALQVLDPDELDLPHENVTRYKDRESNSEVVTYPEAARNAFTAGMDAFMSDLKNGFARSQVDYLSLKSSDSLGRMLARYLENREMF